MKFSKMSQLFLVSTIGLMVAMFLAGCQLVTIDYFLWPVRPAPEREQPGRSRPSRWTRSPARFA